MMLPGLDEGVLEGYAAFRLVDGWIGVIAGNRYCKEYQETSGEALTDAKEMFERMG